METLIAYASKHGCTADCAKKLAVILPGEVTLCDVKTEKPDPASFDVVILGAPVYASMMPGQMKDYYKQHKDTLQSKKAGVFVCCSQPAPKQEEYIEANLPGLLAHASATASFGGEYRWDAMGWVEKKLLKAVLKDAGKKAGAPVEDIQVDEAAIHAFADAMGKLDI